MTVTIITKNGFSSSTEKHSFLITRIEIEVKPVSKIYFEQVASGNFSEFVAVAIGARAQSAKTYLEKHHKTFKDTPVEELCTHALQALAGCVAGDKELDAAAASLAVVTADGQSRLIEDAEVQKYLDLVEVEKTAAQTEGMELKGASS